jgi:hypothetical protein
MDGVRRPGRLPRAGLGGDGEGGCNASVLEEIISADAEVNFVALTVPTDRFGNGVGFGGCAPREGWSAPAIFDGV